MSAEMLVDSSVTWTLVGHSERRDIFLETEELLGAKIAHAQATGMKVVACIGEHKENREAGTTMDVLIPQLQTIVDNTASCAPPARAALRPPPPARPRHHRVPVRAGR
jgi:triosephosphate isomerase